VSPEGGSPGRVVDWRGFRVESDGGRIGVVSLVRRDARFGEPSEIVVRAGRVGKSVFLIAAEEVDVVFPEERSLVLRRGWRLLATDVSSATSGGPSPRAGLCRSRGDVCEAGSDLGLA
jgi:hypothetical protein